MSSMSSPTEMSRDELVNEVKDLRRQTSEMSRDIALIRQSFNAMLPGSDGFKSLDDLPELLESEFAENGSSAGVNRESLLPAHRMWLDVEAGDGDTIGDSQRRAAVLFGQFEQRVVDGEQTEVDASGQKFTLSSGKAREVLEDVGEFDGVKEASRSTITARVMRDVQRLTKVDDCDCDEIDDCNHGVIEFRSGRPHVLAAGKKRFRAAMRNAVEDLAADDASNGNTDAEDKSQEIDKDLDRLNTTNTEVER